MSAAAALAIQGIAVRAASLPSLAEISRVPCPSRSAKAAGSEKERNQRKRSNNFLHQNAPMVKFQLERASARFISHRSVVHPKGLFEETLTFLTRT
jgi:hypothetical protein